MDLSKILQIVQFAIANGPAAVELVLAIVNAIRSAPNEHQQAVARAFAAFDPGQSVPK